MRRALLRLQHQIERCLSLALLRVVLRHQDTVVRRRDAHVDVGRTAKIASRDVALESIASRIVCYDAGAVRIVVTAMRSSQPDLDQGLRQGLARTARPHHAL